MRRSASRLAAPALALLAAALLPAGAGAAAGLAPGQTGNGRQLDPVGRTTTLGAFPTGGALTPDGRFYWAVDAGRGPNSVRIIDVATGQVRQTLSIPGGFVGIVFAADGRRAYVSGPRPTASLRRAIRPGRRGHPRLRRRAGLRRGEREGADRDHRHPRRRRGRRHPPPGAGRQRLAGGHGHQRRRDPARRRAQPGRPGRHRGARHPHRPPRAGRPLPLRRRHRSAAPARLRDQRARRNRHRPRPAEREHGQDDRGRQHAQRLRPPGGPRRRPGPRPPLRRGDRP